MTNLITTDKVAQLGGPNAAVVELTPKLPQSLFVSTAAAASAGQEWRVVLSKVLPPEMSKGTAFNSDDVQRITAGTHDPEEIAVLAAKQLSPP